MKRIFMAASMAVAIGCTASLQPENISVADYKDGKEATFTFGGVAYKATVGKDAFAMFMDAAEAAPADGTVANIDVTVGAAVESGDVLATLN